MVNRPLYPDALYQRLQQRVVEIENQLLRFGQMLATSQADYKRTQTWEVDADRKSLLLEAHTVHLNRQWAAIEKMKSLHQHALAVVASFESDWGLPPPVDEMVQ